MVKTNFLLMTLGRFLFTALFFFTVENGGGLHVLSGKTQTIGEQASPAHAEKKNSNKYKSLTLRVLEKATGIKKDVIFKEVPCTQKVFGLTITCHAGFIEDINNALPVLWAYLEVFQESMGENVHIYANWYNNLKPVFENPDFDMEILEIIP